jgi:ATP-binding cassette subfamily B protein
MHSVGETPEPSRAGPHIRRVIWPYFRGSSGPAGLLIVALLGASATTLATVLTPWLVGRVIDAAVLRERALSAAVLSIFGVAILTTVGDAVRELASSRLRDRFAAHLQRTLMDRLLVTPLSWLQTSQGCEGATLFTEHIPTVARLADPFLVKVTMGTLQFAGGLFILLYKYYDLAWVVAVVVPLNVAFARWRWPRLRQIAEDHSAHKTRLDSFVIQAADNIRELKVLAADHWIGAQLSRLSEQELAAKWRSRLVILQESARYLTTWGLISIVYYIGATSVRNGDLTPGGMTAFVWYASFLESPITRLWSAVSDWQAIRASLQRLGAVFETAPEQSGTAPLAPYAPSVEFRDIDFTYDQSLVAALRDVAFTIPAGAHVAIVGTSGAGKTTLISLLLRLFEPQRGAVLVNGHDSRIYSLRALRSAVTVISQEPLILDASVKDNIEFGFMDSSDDDICAAARMADAHEFITALPGGYQARLGTRGALLSGGQKRRIAIARALLREPRVLVLDEVTGSLDSVSDSAIQQAVSHLRDCTVVTISHRLSSTRHADLIVVLDSGAVVGAGSHESLLESCGLYRTLAGLQGLEPAAAEQ